MTGASRRELLVDSNLLVLYVVGNVNPARIAQFKRTSRYSAWHFQLLLRLLQPYERLLTLPHILTEVSNLTDLDGKETDLARLVLRETVRCLHEEPIQSLVAAEGDLFRRLGLTDSAIAELAHLQGIDVLTDDLDLHLALLARNISSFNFSQISALAMERL